MSKGNSVHRSSHEENTVQGRLKRWILLKGNRLVLTAGIASGVFILTYGLIRAGVIAVGPESTFKTTMGSGVTAGLFTVITVTLTINQLISSRIFGTPGELQDEFQGSRQIRERVAELAADPETPVNTTRFMSFVGETLYQQVERFEREVGQSDLESSDEIEEYVGPLLDFAEQIRSITDQMSPITVLSIMAGPRYAWHIMKTKRFQTKHSDDLAEDAQTTLEAIYNLLEIISISRQYYKTIALQQEFARLSRLLIYTGLPAILTALYVTLVYRTAPMTTLPPAYLPVVASGAITIVLVPLVILLVELLRIATILRYTVSVGPFVPPTEWPWEATQGESGDQ